MVKIFDTSSNYDYNYDIFDIYINKEYKYDSTIKLDEGIFLDFDEDNIPVSLEILDASRITKIDKKNLANSDIEMYIAVSEDLIELNIKFSYPIHNQAIDVSMEKKIANNYNIPVMETTLVSS
jgi:uncharacterized protein YuzE